MAMPMRCTDCGSFKYTSYVLADKILEDFVKKAETESIWVSVEAEGIRETAIGDTFCNILEKALDTAESICIRCTLPKDRFIRLRSREIQHQLLIRIEYSYEGDDPVEIEAETDALGKQIEAAGGYFKHRIENDVGKMNIAFPS